MLNEIQALGRNIVGCAWLVCFGVPTLLFAFAANEGYKYAAKTKKSASGADS